MKAGMELDSLVSSRVMGIVTDRPEHDYQYDISVGEYCGECGLTINEENERQTCIGRLPNYSTDIADAWLVVEKMYELGFSTEIELATNRTPKRFVVRMDKSENLNTSVAETAPLAICKAALKACGVEEEG